MPRTYTTWRRVGVPRLSCRDATNVRFDTRFSDAGMVFCVRKRGRITNARSFAEKEGSRKRAFPLTFCTAAPSLERLPAREAGLFWAQSSSVGQSGAFWAAAQDWGRSSTGASQQLPALAGRLRNDFGNPIGCSKNLWRGTRPSIARRGIAKSSFPAVRTAVYAVARSPLCSICVDSSSRDGGLRSCEVDRAVVTR